MNQVAPEASGATQEDSPPGRAAFVFIFITVLLDMLALGIIIPVLPGLVVGFMGGDTAGGAEILGLFGTAWALMQFLFSPVLGALSDRFGRRPVILISCLGLALDYILMALAPSLWWLFAGTRHLRHHGGELRDRVCLHRGRDAAGAARRALRHARRRVRRGLHPRAGASAALPAASIRACRSGSRRASASPTSSMAG